MSDTFSSNASRDLFRITTRPECTSQTDGDFVMPDVDFEPPWYICGNGHITDI
jgi:hypothetical protein